MSRSRDNWEYRIDETGEVEMTVRSTGPHGHAEEEWVWLSYADVKLMYDLATEARTQHAASHDKSEPAS